MTIAISRADNDDTRRLGPGALVLVVGPSGAGKDTLIRLAKSHFANSQEVRFPRRLITRGVDTYEDHDSVERQVLRQMVLNSDVAFAWTAHGLDYAIPASVDSDIVAGNVVIVNVSRAVIPAVLMKYETVVVAFVTAPTHVLAERLAARGREASDDIAERLKRSATEDLPMAPQLVVIQNIGEPQNSADKLINVIEELQRVIHP